jgi:hypothetical protein
VSGNQLNNGVGRAIVRDVVFGGMAGKTVVGGIAALHGSDDARHQGKMIHGLDEWVEVDVGLVGFGLAFLVVHFAHVDAQMHEEVNHVHQQLLGHLGDFCNNGNLLAVGATFEEELGWILWIVGRNKHKIILVHCVESWLAVGQHELLKYFVGHHQRIPTDGGWGRSGRHLVSVGNMGIKDIKTGMAYVDASFIVVLFKGVLSFDGVLSRVWERSFLGAICL